MSTASPFLSSKLPLHVWGSGPHLTHGSLGPFESISQTAASRSVQPLLEGSRLLQTNRLTNHATPSVATGRIHLPSAAIQPNNNKQRHYSAAKLYFDSRGNLPWCSSTQSSDRTADTYVPLPSTWGVYDPAAQTFQTSGKDQPCSKQTSSQCEAMHCTAVYRHPI